MIVTSGCFELNAQNDINKSVNTVRARMLLEVHVKTLLLKFSTDIFLPSASKKKLIDMTAHGLFQYS